MEALGAEGLIGKAQEWGARRETLSLAMGAMGLVPTPGLLCKPVLTLCFRTYRTQPCPSYVHVCPVAAAWSLGVQWITHRVSITGTRGYLLCLRLAPVFASSCTYKCPHRAPTAACAPAPSTHLAAKQHALAAMQPPGQQGFHR